MRTTNKIDSLNGIRGFAVLLVLLSHASNEGLNIHPFLNFSGAGRYGVFLFFVLSAFLLTRQFLDVKPENSEIRTFVTHYFLRRFLRIFPLFTAALMIYFLLHKIGLSIYPVDGAMFLKSLFLLDAEGIFWTIPVEFQYYFLLPLVALALMSTSRFVFVLTSIALFVVTWWHFIPPDYTTHLLPFLPIFLLGSAAAFISAKVTGYGALRPSLMGLCNFFAAISVFLFIVFTPNYYNRLFNEHVGVTAFHKEFLLFALVSCCLVIFTVHGNGLVKKIMESRIMVFWGNVSFSAYLGHMIVMRVVGKITYGPEIKWFMFMILTAGFAYLSFKYFELPLSKQSTFEKFFTKFKVKSA